MVVIFLIIFVFLLVMFPTFRCAVTHPFAVVYNGVWDLWKYIAHKEYNLCGSGELVAYTGLFGKGKTLSAVHRVVSAYKQYDGKKVWCRRRKKFVNSWPLPMQRPVFIFVLHFSLPALLIRDAAA